MQTVQTCPAAGCCVGSWAPCMRLASERSRKTEESVRPHPRRHGVPIATLPCKRTLATREEHRKQGNGGVQAPGGRINADGGRGARSRGSVHTDRRGSGHERIQCVILEVTPQIEVAPPVLYGNSYQSVTGDTTSQNLWSRAVRCGPGWTFIHSHREGWWPVSSLSPYLLCIGNGSQRSHTARVLTSD